MPLVETNWKGSKRNDDLYRFGLIWKVYDMVTIRGLNWRPPILTSIPIQFDRWILGGYSGTDFIMAPVEFRTPLKNGTIGYKTVDAPERIDFIGYLGLRTKGAYVVNLNHRESD